MFAPLLFLICLYIYQLSKKQAKNLFYANLALDTEVTCIPSTEVKLTENFPILFNHLETWAELKKKRQLFT